MSIEKVELCPRCKVAMIKNCPICKVAKDQTRCVLSAWHGSWQIKETESIFVLNAKHFLSMTMKKKSTVNKSGNYTKPAMRKRLFQQIKASGKGGSPGQW